MLFRIASCVAHLVQLACEASHALTMNADQACGSTAHNSGTTAVATLNMSRTGISHEQST